MGFLVVSGDSTDHDLVPQLLQDHRLRPGPWRQPEPWTSICPEVAVQATHLNMVSVVAQPRHQHGFRLQHTPQTFARSSVVTQAPDISTEPGCIRTADPDTALSSSTVGVNLASGGTLSFLGLVVVFLPLLFVLVPQFSSCFKLHQLNLLKSKPACSFHDFYVSTAIVPFS